VKQRERRGGSSLNVLFFL